MAVIGDSHGIDFFNGMDMAYSGRFLMGITSPGCRPAEPKPDYVAECPYDAFAAGLGDHKIVTTLCPGGKERMRRLMEVISSGRADLRAMVTHRFKLDQIEEAYDLFSHQRDGVMKVALTP